MKKYKQLLELVTQKMSTMTSSLPSRRKAAEKKPEGPPPPPYHASQYVFVPAGTDDVRKLPFDTIIELAQANLMSALAGECNRQRVIIIHPGENKTTLQRIFDAACPRTCSHKCTKGWCNRALRATDRTEGLPSSCATWEASYEEELLQV